MTRRKIFDGLDDANWAEVPGYEGFYEVSDDGRLRSLDRDIVMRDQVMKFELGRSRKLMTLFGDYKIVEIRRDNFEFVHRIVLAAFIGPCPEGARSRHIDGNHSNNNLSNLEWFRPVEGYVAEDVANPASEVQEIREAAARGQFHTDLAVIYSKSRSTIGRIVRGEGRWANV